MSKEREDARLGSANDMEQSLEEIRVVHHNNA